MLHIRKAFTSQVNHDLGLFSIGIITSCITGLVAIKFLLAFLKRYPLNLFAYYRFILSAVIIAGIWLKG
jgi:undecaprenyl-diphosphatase